MTTEPLLSVTELWLIIIIGLLLFLGAGVVSLLLAVSRRGGAR